MLVLYRWKELCVSLCVCALPELRFAPDEPEVPSCGHQTTTVDGFRLPSLRMRVQSILLVHFHLELVYLVTAFVPSDTACLASSPGRSRRTAVWISRDVIVERLL